MEEVILSHLTYNEKYARKVLPELTEDLFAWDHEKLVFKTIKNYTEAYNTLPSREVLYIELENTNDISENVFTEAKTLIGELKPDETTNTEWLVDQTEAFVQDRSLQNAIRSSIRILDGQGEHTKAAIPKLLQDALSISFNKKVGHDFFEDAQERFRKYQEQEDLVRFNLDYLNRITDGGLPPKTLTCFMAPTGVGKSMCMGSLAAGNLMDQKNVLYITLEMAQEKIAQRIEANLLDVSLYDFKNLTSVEYERKMAKVQETTKGRLIVQEYPPTGASVTHFRTLIDELKIKRNFVPDIIYIDYLNIAASSRVKMGGGANSYTYIKAIAEEIRGLAVEYEVPIVTATQTNREAFGASDYDMTSTSESMGLPMTVDMLIGIISTEELDEEGMIMMKQLKNRFGDPGMYRRFMVGVNKAKMRLYDAEQQDDEDTPVMDNSDLGTVFGGISSNEMFKGFSK
jgi:replicative DNA helicase